jgi:hypothetical protein
MVCTRITDGVLNENEVVGMMKKKYEFDFFDSKCEKNNNILTIIKTSSSSSSHKKQS